MELTDPTFVPNSSPGLIDRWARGLIRDERDLPFVRLSAFLTLTIIPAAVALYIPGVFRWYLAVPYLAFELYMLGPFVLMLHNTSHRRLFNTRHLNHFIPWVLGPFFGETPETYFVHHIGMHHPENNLSEDLSSTMRFNRSSFLGFMVYFGRFFCLALWDLSRYLLRRRRFKLMRRMLIGELSFYALVTGLCFLNWKATLVVFGLPFLFSRFGMMAGNWAQHAFIDAEDPSSPYKNSITCINSLYNRRCFNDGYHIGHHIMANRHWTQLPADFDRNRRKYGSEGAVVFEKIDFFVVWIFLMLKRWNWLARYYVNLSNESKSQGEIIALLKQRTQPIRKPKVDSRLPAA